MGAREKKKDVHKKFCDNLCEDPNLTYKYKIDLKMNSDFIFSGKKKSVVISNNIVVILIKIC